MVPHTREVLDSPPPDEDHRVLLKVMAHARDIGCHLNSIGQTDSSNLSQGRIGLLGGRSIHAHTDPSLLRALSQGRSRCFLLHGPSRTTYQLVYCRHSTNSGKVRKIISLKINNNKLFCQGLAAPPRLPISPISFERLEEKNLFPRQLPFQPDDEADMFITRNFLRCQGKILSSFRRFRLA